MGPGQSRFLIWGVPTVALFFTLLWYRRKRGKNGEFLISKPAIEASPKPVEELTPKKEETQSIETTPIRTPFSRSLSGVDTAPIDIKTNRSPPLIVSDKDLDIEIEKMKSMKSTLVSHSSDISNDSLTIDKMKNSINTSPVNKMQTPIIKTCAKQGSESKKSAKVCKKLANQSPVIKKSGDQSPVRNSLSNQSLVSQNGNSPVHTELESPIISGSHSPEIRDSANHSPVEQIITATRVEETSHSLEVRETANQSPGIRDSANHSPADAMLASPSCSIASDGHHSDSDSGKGGSDVATPPPPTQEQQEASCLDLLTTKYIIHEFVIPQNLVGRLIGRHGAFVHQIKAKTNANILIKRHPENVKGIYLFSIYFL